ncbi:hypothetical protein [Catellatospora chokoriensis]|uniref:Uncharacterized protein n=1 Tax=Catellatospora chokoriensis TaxID=310353 RepID=A0A8J3NSD0_9ACTN|nr:hypothetical protein [Catellatospora chokoriensis]GIF90388.1 hypothetical protein Cch02nite_38320 [Catellatospora chokoriensis]
MDTFLARIAARARGSEPCALSLRVSSRFEPEEPTVGWPSDEPAGEPPEHVPLDRVPMAEAPAETLTPDRFGTAGARPSGDEAALDPPLSATWPAAAAPIRPKVVPDEPESERGAIAQPPEPNAGGAARPADARARHSPAEAAGSTDVKHVVRASEGPAESTDLHSTTPRRLDAAPHHAVSAAPIPSHSANPVPGENVHASAAPALPVPGADHQSDTIAREQPSLQPADVDAGTTAAQPQPSVPVTPHLAARPAQPGATAGTGAAGRAAARPARNRAKALLPPPAGPPPTRVDTSHAGDGQHEPGPSADTPAGDDPHPPPPAAVDIPGLLRSQLVPLLLERGLVEPHEAAGLRLVTGEHRLDDSDGVHLNIGRVEVVRPAEPRRAEPQPHSPPAGPSAADRLGTYAARRASEWA